MPPRLRWLTRALLLLLAGPAFAASPGQPVPAEPPVQIATLQWEPYVGEYLDNQGFTTHIVRRAFAAAGRPVKIHFTSWSRALKGTSSGKYDAAFPAYYSAERADKYLVSDVIGHSRLGFVARRDAPPIEYRTLRDLTGLRIGVVKDYVNTPAFDAADYLTRITAWDDGANLNRLLIGRLDLIVIDFNTARFILEVSLPEQVEAVTYIQPLLQEKELHLLFGRDRNDLLEAFNRGLRIITESGEFDAIHREFGSS